MIHTDSLCRIYGVIRDKIKEINLTRYIFDVFVAGYLFSLRKVKLKNFTVNDPFLNAAGIRFCAQQVILLQILLDNYQLSDLRMLQPFTY